MTTHSAFAAWVREYRGRIRHVAVLTGAGISAESGIPTFRGRDGLWRGKDPAELFTPEALLADPVLVWQMYDELRGRIAAAAPNPGHIALAALERQCAVSLATQNIDGLHQRAGSRHVQELHGTLWRVRCDVCGDGSVAHTTAPLRRLPPRCPHCAGILRPDIVLFSESLPTEALHGAVRAAETCDLMLVVGTSGVVYPAAGLPRIARAHGAVVMEVNPQETLLSAEVDYTVRAPAAIALPALVAQLTG